MLGFGGSGVLGRDGSCLGDGGRLEGGRALGRRGSSICRRLSITGYGMLMVTETSEFATMDQGRCWYVLIVDWSKSIDALKKLHRRVITEKTDAEKKEQRFGEL